MGKTSVSEEQRKASSISEVIPRVRAYERSMHRNEQQLYKKRVEGCSTFFSRSTRGYKNQVDAAGGVSGGGSGGGGSS